MVPPALDLLVDLVRFEREMQLQAFDAIDAKAGSALGFSGALVGPATLASDGLWLVPGVILGAFAAGFSMAVLMAGHYERQNPEESKRWWLWVDADQAREELMNSEILALRRVDAPITSEGAMLEVGLAYTHSGCHAGCFRHDRQRRCRSSSR